MPATRSHVDVGSSLPSPGARPVAVVVKTTNLPSAESDGVSMPALLTSQKRC
jgi:hypothetical protein